MKKSPHCHAPDISAGYPGHAVLWPAVDWQSLLPDQHFGHYRNHHPVPAGL